MRAHPTCFALLLLALAAVPARSAPVGARGIFGPPQIQVSIAELPPLAGHNESFANDINDRGLVVGFSEALNDVGQRVALRPVYWANPPTRALPLPVGTDAGRAFAVNNGGLIAGDTELLPGPQRATAWSKNVPKVLGGFPGSGRSAIFGLTERGYGVGAALDAAGRERAAFWINGRVLDMGTLPGFFESRANNVNRFNRSAGVALKAGQRRAILFNGTVAQEPTELPGIFESGGHDLNDFNEMVGFSVTPGGREVATLWRGLDVVETLVGPPANGDAEALAINNRGIIAGHFRAPGVGPRGALWVDGFFFDLENLLPLGSGWTQLRPARINEKDQIVGTGRHNGAVRGFAMQVRRL